MRSLREMFAAEMTVKVVPRGDVIGLFYVEHDGVSEGPFRKSMLESAGLACDPGSMGLEQVADASAIELLGLSNDE